MAGDTGMDLSEENGRVVDNDNIGEKQRDTAFIKCERCGGNMKFDPQTQSLKCEHCGSVEKFEKDKNVNEQNIEKGFDDAESWSGEATLFRCENCGAEVILKSGEVAASCPFCSTPHIVKCDEMPGIKPQAVYPFEITKQQAADEAKKWARKKLFAPRKFKKNLTHGEISGIYQPCFTFDSDTFSKYYGRIGKRCTRTVKTSKGTRTETYIKWYNVSGTYSKFFDDVFISSGNMPQGELEKLLPYRIDTLCVYEQKFLSGYAANHYKKDLKSCWGDAKKIIDADLRRAILAKYDCTEVDYLNVSTTHENVTYKYVLLPIYRSNFRYRKKEYPVSVNGNTGKVCGKTPVSPLRVIIAVLLAMALAVGLFYLFASGDSCDSDFYYYFSAPADKNYAVCEQNYDYSVFQSFAICENMPKTFDINGILS